MPRELAFLSDLDPSRELTFPVLVEEEHGAEISVEVPSSDFERDGRTMRFIVRPVPGQVFLLKDADLLGPSDNYRICVGYEPLIREVS